ncbi:MAG: TRAP transporter small permease, partial [Alphaproteobacteria bacterium]|nr:TRAP transporter small permease [Alphaproteobacteria bacterium]MBU1830856.1 TRAP transporter small permease [Alphaproteobacteria bacterium]
MTQSQDNLPKTPIAGFFDALEENLIALILGLMTLVTFVNVVMRYLFNDSLIWGLEVVLILFAWLVLLGIPYGFKKTSHLGVDAVINMLPSRGHRILAILSALACVVYAALLMKGAWDYWA